MSLEVIMHPTDETLDEFSAQLDTFVDANNEACRLLTKLQFDAIHLVESGAAYTREHYLTATYSSFVQTLEAMVDLITGMQRFPQEARKRKMVEQLAAQSGLLGTAVRKAHNCFRFGYNRGRGRHSVQQLGKAHPLVAAAYLDLQKAIAGGSKPDVDLDTVTNAEELVRALHKIAIDVASDSFYQLSAYSSLHDRPRFEEYTLSVHFYTDDARVSPMFPVVEAMEQYFELADWTKFKFKHATISDRAFAAHAPMGQHQAFLKILYDKEKNEFALTWSLNEPGYGDGRIKYCSKLFPELGFKHITGWNWHQATKRSDREGIRELVQTILFLTDNMSNLDMGGGRHKPEELAQIWRAMFRHQQIRDGVIERRNVVDTQEYKDRRARRYSWTPQQDRILQTLMDDPFPLDLTEPIWFRDNRRPRGWPRTIRLNVVPNPGLWIAANADYFFPEGVAVAELKRFYRDTMDVLFNCFEVYKPKAIWDENDNWIQVPDERIVHPIGTGKRANRQFHRGFRRGFEGYVQAVIEGYRKSGYRIQDYVPADVLPPEVVKDGLLAMQTRRLPKWGVIQC